MSGCGNGKILNMSRKKQFSRIPACLNRMDFRNTTDMLPTLESVLHIYILSDYTPTNEGTICIQTHS